MKKIYSVYDSNDQCVCVGTAQECMAYTGYTLGSLRSNASRTKSGERKGCTYRIYVVEDDE